MTRPADTHTAEAPLTEEQFLEALRRFSKASHQGDVGQVMMLQSALVLHNKALLAALSREQQRADDAEKRIDSLNECLIATQQRREQLEAEREQWLEGFVRLYRVAPTSVANVCDKWLDKRGALLGVIRARAALAVPDPAPPKELRFRRLSESD